AQGARLGGGRSGRARAAALRAQGARRPLAALAVAARGRRLAWSLRSRPRHELARQMARARGVRGPAAAGAVALRLLPGLARAGLRFAQLREPRPERLHEVEALVD